MVSASRLALPRVGFFCILIGSAVVQLWSHGPAWRAVIAGLFLLQIASSLHAFPNYLPYSNELFGGPANAHRDLADSNVDWGQSLRACYVERFTTMIRSYKGISPTIPQSCYVDESAQVIGDVVLGENASVWMNAVVRGDVHSIRIGANSNIQDCSVLHGMLNQWPVIVGEWVTVGHNVTLHGCVVGDRCLIGMGVIVLNGARIGEGSILAAGTLITEKMVVEPGSLVMGVPGTVRKQLTDEDQETILRYGRNYLGYKDTYLAERGR